MTIATVSSLSDALQDSRLLNLAQQAELQRDLLPRHREPRGLARELLHKGWLTAYQINQIFQHRIDDLFLDQYVLLERIGEGGMGQVFKARHHRMARVVALKVLRRDRLSTPEAVGRFHREVRAAAQVAHPNIVTAYDAGDANGTCFFAMEYIDGPDLGRLVKKGGALPIRTACSYIRQAACGLQHAFTKGLVHRDIKPSNLLLAPPRAPVLQGPHSSGLARTPSPDLPPIVKILDLGLARLLPGFNSDTGNTLTQAQIVLGTPDFIAPEQARSSRMADVRSDLYSLGCTFYYLLTGQVPFPADLPMEKLLKHYLEEAIPLGDLRPEIPPEVEQIVQRLMRKEPDQRYQTPQELVDALDAHLGGRTLPDFAPLTPTTEADQVPLAHFVVEAEHPVEMEPPLFATLAECALEFETNTNLSALPVQEDIPKLARRLKTQNKPSPLVVCSLVFLVTTLVIFLALWFGLR